MQETAAQVRKRFNSATQLRFKAQEITFIKNKNAILLLSGLVKHGGLAGIININRGRETLEASCLQSF